MNPVIFELGPLQLHWYGVFIVGGSAIAAWVGSRYAAKAGDNPDHIWNLLAWTLIFGIIGARLYHVFSSPADGLGWAYYRTHPVDIFNPLNGGFRGLGIYGGLAGGLLAIAIYCWYSRLNPLRYMDYMAPTVPLAQAIGRMGNFVNQELYGPATDKAWAFHINPRFPCQLPPDFPASGIQPCGSPNLTPETIQWFATHGYHPTFFYEAAWNLVMFVILALIIRRYGQYLRRGDTVLLYLIAYPLGRFWVEMFRPDAWMMGTLPTAQWIAIGCIIFAIIGLFIRHRNWSGSEHPEESLAHMSAAGVKPVPA